MSQPITQAKVQAIAHLEEQVLEWIEGGMFLDEVAKRIDPDRSLHIEKTFLSRWLSGRIRLNTGPNPETEEHARARAKRYKLARLRWSESIVEENAQRLFNETNDKMANLRKNQAEFAMKLAGVHNEDYRERKGPDVAVQVNVGDLHLNALQRRFERVLQAERGGTTALPPASNDEIVVEPEVQ